MDYHIRAFGACMIGGFPHRYEDSCFHLATERLRKESGHNIIPSIFTLGGFPVTHAVKYLETKGLADAPDILVVEFGPSDLTVPVRKRNRRHHCPSSQRQVSTVGANWVHQLRWCLRGVIADVLQLRSVTPPEVYIETMGQLVRTVTEHQTTPVVLSPFVLGTPRANRFARHCVARLEAIMAAIPNAHFVDAYSVLDRHSYRQMLLGDGTHLSLQGQALVGECLFVALNKIIEAQVTDGQLVHRHAG